MTAQRAPFRLAWFATGTGETSPKLLRAALDEMDSGRLRAEIVVVFSNREPGENPASDNYHSLVRQRDIPLITLSDRRFRRERGGQPARKNEPLPEWRLEYDREVMRLLEPYPFDLGVLAGYKLIFCAEAARHWNLLNLHPAEPGGPKGVWQDVIWELIDSRADHAGIMMHLATPVLDEGPPVTYCTYPIRGADFDQLWQELDDDTSIENIRSGAGENHPLFRQIRQRGVEREIPLIIATLRAFAEDRIRIESGAIINKSGSAITPIDLTPEIDRLISLAT